jgi:hypothetical protein
VSGSTTSATSPKPELRLLSGFIGTTPSGLTRRLAIAVRASSAGYNRNSWLDSSGALHVVHDSELSVRELVAFLRLSRADYWPSSTTAGFAMVQLKRQGSSKTSSVREARDVKLGRRWRHAERKPARGLQCSDARAPEPPSRAGRRRSVQ